EGTGEEGQRHPRFTAAREEIPKILEEAEYSRNLYGSVRDALNEVRRVNEVTTPKGCLIRFDTKRHQVRESPSGNGISYYHGRLVWPVARFPVSRHYNHNEERIDYGGVSAMDWVRLVSGVYGFAWKMDKGEVVLTDPEDAKALKATGEVVDAATLVAELKKTRVGFLKQYRKKRILLCGVVSGVGKSMGREFVNLADDRVRVLISSKRNEEKLAALRSLYRKKNKRVPYIRNQTRLPFLFVMTGKCDGEDRGRIVVKGTGQFSWMILPQDN
ncbi:MAG: hypothetical protein KAI66_27885, partial [Lentisphaeria bacterium]|nr:hypothetical protein [Lentisphaeria bacterium]